MQGTWGTLTRYQNGDPQKLHVVIAPEDAHLLQVEMDGMRIVPIPIRLVAHVVDANGGERVHFIDAEIILTGAEITVFGDNHPLGGRL